MQAGMTLKILVWFELALGFVGLFVGVLGDRHLFVPSSILILSGTLGATLMSSATRSSASS